MNPSALALALFIAWALALLLLMEVLRSHLVLTGRVPSNGFTPDNAGLSPFMQRLARVVQALGVAVVHHVLRSAAWIGGAEVGGLQKRPQSPLGRDGVLLDELLIGRDHAAEILRPRLVGGAVDHHLADLLRP